ncbi:unnamed protein product [Sphagnum troendelagicum]|uniref:E3 ubiquitin protein ligase RIN2 n=1 Tax=Sphagnum troendelagicum TaxID=128251 RepID=A0ABP0UWY9_9BRYO
MGAGYGLLVALYTLVSAGGIAWRINSALRNDFWRGGGGGGALDPVEAARVLQSLLQSSFTLALLGNLLLAFFLLITLCVKRIFFGQLSLMETQKVVERLINYVLFKGLFLTWVVRPELMQIAVWLAWFAILGCIKMFQGLARDRLVRLDASPTATMLAHIRVFAVLVLVLLFDLLLMQLFIVLFKDTGMSTFLLLLFEPLSIAFDTLQAVVVHGMQLMDTWQRQTLDLSVHTSGLEPSKRSAAGVSWEWRGTLVRNCSFVMDLVSLLLALGHCVHIWWLRGVAFQVVDAILFLNLRALLSAISKRIKGFMRLRTAMTTLQGALPDATQVELLEYEDDCAICKEPMARAKRLPCAHLFHLSCLRSWLDQGLADTYSCPTCRRPLFMGSTRLAPPSDLQRSVDAPIAVPDLQAHDLQHLLTDASLQSPTHAVSEQPLSSPHWNNAPVTTSWTGPGGERSDTAADQVLMGTTPGSLERLQLMMRQLSGDGRAHSPTDGNACLGWHWHFGGETSTRTGSRRSRAFATAPQMWHSDTSMGTGVGNTQIDVPMSTMVSMVREVLPHVPVELITQDLQQTNSVTATVNNLL